MIKPVYITAKNLDDCYFQLLSQLHNNGRENYIDEGSFKGHVRLEFDNISAYIEHPSTRPLSPVFPENMTPITNDNDIEDYFVNYLMNGELSNEEHYKYATWIVGGEYNMPKCAISSPDINIESEKDNINRMITINVPNQLEWIINHYNKKGFHNNHCCIKIGYPESCLAYDQPYENENERNTSPCMVMLDTKIIKNDDEYKLLLSTYFRSNDLYSGFPVNMGGIILLGEYVCEMLNCEISLGGLFYNSLKCHCYDFELEMVKTRLNI